MPAIVKVQVIAARDLPVMDRSSDSTDCFVEIRLGQTIHRTDVCKKTLYPEWDSTVWHTFNVNDNELQDEPLTFKVMDYDQYTAHDAIGRVYISLNSGIFEESTSSLQGWFPIYDTLHGIRGAVHIRVMVEMIRDLHRHKQSSSEIMLFSGLVVPDGFTLEAIQGFVEELVVNDDPEYQWIDRIRPPRASNESRQQVFLKLSGELQRKIGMKVLEAGGNAIIGYSQCFDLEGESGIVVRGIGTSVTIRPITSSRPLTYSTSYQQPQQNDDASVTKADRPIDEDGSVTIPHAAATNSSVLQEKPDMPSSKPSVPRFRQVSSSESADGGTVGEPGTHLLGTSSGSGGGVISSSTSEFSFYSMKSFPSGFIKTIGGIVTAHSVKLLDDINNPDEPETRDAWWLEIRQEIKSHSLSMNCDSVIGYSEKTSICDGLCIFSGTGTAVMTNYGAAAAAASETMATLESPDGLVTKNIDNLLAGIVQPPSTSTDHINVSTATAATTAGDASVNEDLDETLVFEEAHQVCSLCHIPYPSSTSPHSIHLKPCVVCKSKQVPSILLSTGEIPPELLTRGEGCLVQARVCRPKKRLRNEENASFVSTELPFLEYSLHGRLLNKLRTKGMNALFGLNIQVSVGDTMLIGLATGTGVYLEALPFPGKIVYQPQESALSGSSSQHDVQSNVDKLQEQNRTRYSVHKPVKIVSTVEVAEGTDINDITSLSPRPSSLCLDTVDTDAAYGQDTKPLEVNDQKLKSEDACDLLNDIPIPDVFHVSSLSSVPGIPDKMITNVSKVMTFVSKQIFDSRGSHDQQLISLMNKVLQTMLFKVRGMVPCVVTNVWFEVELPDDDEVQVMLVAVITRMMSGDSLDLCDEGERGGDSHRIPPQEEFMFSMDSGGRGLEAVSFDNSSNVTDSHRSSVITNTNKEQSFDVNKFIMTPRPLVCNPLPSKYLSTINLFLIRETTSIREFGGMSSFLHTFISEAHALARAHVLFLGGNALVNYQLRQCVVMENHHKNQGQCLLNLAGDAALIQREFELCD